MTFGEFLDWLDDKLWIFMPSEGGASSGSSAMVRDQIPTKAIEFFIAGILIVVVQFVMIELASERLIGIGVETLRRPPQEAALWVLKILPWIFGFLLIFPVFVNSDRKLPKLEWYLWWLYIFIGLGFAISGVARLDWVYEYLGASLSDFINELGFHIRELDYIFRFGIIFITGSLALYLYKGGSTPYIYWIGGITVIISLITLIRGRLAISQRSAQLAS